LIGTQESSCLDSISVTSPGKRTLRSSGGCLVGGISEDGTGYITATLGKFGQNWVNYGSTVCVVATLVT
jgi:hypothetical protein